MRQLFPLVLLGTSIGAPAAVSQNLEDQVLMQSIYEQVLPCWDGVADLEHASKLIVSIQVIILEDGSLSSEPVVLRPSLDIRKDQETQTAVRRAVSAVKECAPIDIPSARAPLTVNFNFGPISPGPTLG